MALSLAEFMKEASNIIIAHEIAQATKHNEARKEELKELPGELAAQEEKIKGLQALAEQARQTLRKAEKEGLNGIADPFETLKKWAEKYGAWRGWEGEIEGPESLPPFRWVRHSRNLNFLTLSQYKRIYDLVKRGKKKVLKEYLENLKSGLEKAQENLNHAQQSYDFDKDRYERLKRRVQNFAQELERIREDLTPQTQEDFESLLEDVWEEEDQREEVLKLIPSKNYEFEEEVQFTSVIRNHTIHLSDAVLNFETYA